VVAGTPSAVEPVHPTQPATVVITPCALAAVPINKIAITMAVVNPFFISIQVTDYNELYFVKIFITNVKNRALIAKLSAFVKFFENKTTTGVNTSVYPPLY
jgi:hypothetical protein